VQQLKITLLGGAPRSRPTDPVAYNLFLQGRYFLDQFSAENLEKAGELYQRVLEIDPDYPPGLKGLAEVRANQAAWGLIPFDEGLDTARSLVYRAAELDPGRTAAWYWLGMAYLLNGDFDQALESVQREENEPMRLTGLTNGAPFSGQRGIVRYSLAGT